MTEPRNSGGSVRNVQQKKSRLCVASGNGRTAYRKAYRCGDGLGLGPRFMTRWAIGCMAAIAIAGSPFAQTPIDRGSYLVNGVLTCGNCHTPRSPSGAWDMSKQLSGRPRTWDQVTFKVNAA